MWEIFVFLGLLLIYLRWAWIASVACIAYIRRKQRRAYLEQVVLASGWPSLTVLIPAYNESATLAGTLDSVLASRYEGEWEVLVIDDGSQDDTVAIARYYAKVNPHVRVLERGTNGGKAAALNVGIRASSLEGVVTIDADTLLEPDALHWMGLNLAEPGVGAVTCSLKVGNRVGWLPIWQSIEYTTGIQVERRVQSFLNCITTLSGAASAYRRSALDAVGGFSSDTITEDTDITLALVSSNQRLVFEDRAIAWTEVPTSLYGFYRQRFRWLFGSLQCVWKHRRTLWTSENRAYVWFGFPNFFFVNSFIFLLFPFYLVYVGELIWGFSWAGLAFFGLAFLLDLSLSLLAYLFAREQLRELLHGWFQRNFYIVFFGLLFLWIVLSWLKRVDISWGKLERSGRWMKSKRSETSSQQVQGAS